MKPRVSYFFGIIVLALGLILLIYLAQVFTNRNINGLKTGNRDAAITFTVQNSLQEIVNIVFALENRLSANRQPSAEDAVRIKDSLTLIGFNSSVLSKLKIDTASNDLLQDLHRQVDKQVSHGFLMVNAIANNEQKNYSTLRDSLSKMKYSDSVYRTAVAITLQLQSKLQDTFDQNTKNSASLSAYNKILALIAIAAILILATIIINRHLWQKKLIQDLEVANQQVEKSALVKEQFLANMSHEIRTPLNAIRGFIGLMLQTDLKKDQAEYASIISKSSDNLLEIVNDILDISKIEAGELKLETKTFNLEEIMQMLGLIFANSAHQKNLQFHWEIASSTPTFLEGDSDRLNQILMNLISNAIKFTNEGSISIKIGEIKRSGLTSWIRFCVEDTGIGISEEKQAKIFERFYQDTNKEALIQEGTGLGLAIVKSLVSLMGGEVLVKSELSKGSSFIVCLPFLINEKITTQQETELPAEQLQFSGVKVLIAEDNNVNQLLLKYLLINYGIDPVFCENGKEALEILDQESFDLLLLDIQMPVMNGYETIEKLRTHNRLLPVVAMTAYVMPGEKEKCLAAGMNEYLAKPIDNKALQQVLIKFLADKRVIRMEKNKIKNDAFVMGLVGGNRDLADKILSEVRKELKIAAGNLEQQSHKPYHKDQLRAFCHHLISTISPLGTDIAAMDAIKQLQNSLAENAADKQVEKRINELRTEIEKLQQDEVLLPLNKN